MATTTSYPVLMMEYLKLMLAKWCYIFLMLVIRKPLFFVNLKHSLNRHASFGVGISVGISFKIRSR
jgi:hypothetical protein